MSRSTKLGLLQEALGLIGMHGLAARLKVPESLLQTWLAGHASMPDRKFLMLVDLLDGLRNPAELTVPVEPLAERPSLRVVVADDEPDTVTSLTAILCDEGHSVFGAHHGAEVMPEIRLHKPDAVVLDIDMPGISGYTLARDIRELFGDDSPVLIAVSGKWVGETDKMLAALAGFDHFLQKPCHPEVLLSLLEPKEPKPVL